MQCQETVRAVDEVVRETLAWAGIEAPPIDPAEVAAALDLVAQRDQRLQPRGERRTVGGRSVILIRPDERSERECFALAHEIGEEIAAGAIIDRLGVMEDRERWREELANQFAGRLLCPLHWLRRQTAGGEVDLRALKAVFATASHEVIARGLLLLEVPTVISIFDNGRLTARQGNRPCPRRLCELEESVWRACHLRRGDQDQQAGSLRVQAWAIHEEDWRREILRTTRLDE